MYSIMLHCSLKSGYHSKMYVMYNSPLGGGELERRAHAINIFHFHFYLVFKEEIFGILVHTNPGKTKGETSRGSNFIF